MIKNINGNRPNVISDRDPNAVNPGVTARIISTLMLAIALGDNVHTKIGKQNRFLVSANQNQKVLDLQSQVMKHLRTCLISNLSGSSFGSVIHNENSTKVQIDVPVDESLIRTPVTFLESRGRLIDAPEFQGAKYTDAQHVGKAPNWTMLVHPATVVAHLYTKGADFAAIVTAQRLSSVREISVPLHIAVAATQIAREVKEDESISAYWTQDGLALMTGDEARTVQVRVLRPSVLNMGQVARAQRQASALA